MARGMVNGEAIVVAPDYGAMSVSALMQMEWRGAQAAFWGQALGRMEKPPADQVMKHAILVDEGKAADAELSRRGIEERYT